MNMKEHMDRQDSEGLRSLREMIALRRKFAAEHYHNTAWAREVSLLIEWDKQVRARLEGK